MARHVDTYFDVAAATLETPRSLPVRRPFVNARHPRPDDRVHHRARQIQLVLEGRTAVR